jgi:hypothetical protein
MPLVADMEASYLHQYFDNKVAHVRTPTADQLQLVKRHLLIPHA